MATATSASQKLSPGYDTCICGEALVLGNVLRIPSLPLLPDSHYLFGFPSMSQIDVWKLLVLDRNLGNHVIVWKQIIIIIK